MNGVLVTFLLLNETPDSHKLKEDRFTLAHDFGRFSPWLALRQNQTVEGSRRRGAAHIMMAKKQREKGEVREGKETSPSTGTSW